MQETLIAFATEKVAEVLKKDTRVLILGGRTTNFPRDLRDDLRLVFWDTLDQDTRRPKPLPDDVGVVLMTKFNRHEVTARVREGCAKIGTLIIGPLANGQITKLLREVIAELQEETIEASDAFREKREKPDYTELPDFLIDQIPSNALGSGLLGSEQTLEQLQQKAEQRWPGISVQRVRRALRHALYTLGLFTDVGAAASSAPDVPDVGEDVDERAKEMERLKRRVEELESKLSTARGEIRAQKNKVRGLERDLRGREQDLRFITMMFLGYLEPIIADGGIIAFYNEKARATFDRIVKDYGQPE